MYVSHVVYIVSGLYIVQDLMEDRLVPQSSLVNERHCYYYCYDQIRCKRRRATLSKQDAVILIPKITEGRCMLDNSFTA